VTPIRIDGFMQQLKNMCVCAGVCLINAGVGACLSLQA